MNTWKPIAAALIIFAAGVITGGLTVNLRRSTATFNASAASRPSRPERAEAINPSRAGHPPLAEGQLRELSQRIGRSLSLTRDQRERIQAILKETQNRMRSLADEMVPRTREELRHMRERIREELSPEQRRQFEEMYRAREGRQRRLDPLLTPPAVRTNEGAPPL